MFHMFLTHVASVLSGCCICCNDYVANVCSKYFICFRRVLQLFHLRVAEVDMDVGLLSEEERASAGAMAASMSGGDVDRAAPLWKRWGVIGAAWKRSAQSSVVEAGEASVWERRAKSSERRGQRSRRELSERGHGKRSWRGRHVNPRDQGEAGAGVWTCATVRTPERLSFCFITA
jgi:hypothetical protein